MVFYGWWDVRFLALMVLTCLVNYAIVCRLALKDDRDLSQELLDKSSQNYRKILLVLGLIINFGILGVFKYYNFFAQSLSALLQQFGITLDAVTLDVMLPVGISFYTFQLSAYLIDCYRRKSDIIVRPTLLTFMSFITFFPQLVAGPIERASDLLGQLDRKRHFDFGRARDGMRLILWGLMKKMLLADNCAAVSNLIFEGHATASSLDLWLGALAFTFQIYGDFSGYSDMAIGSAHLLGVRLSPNFDRPYFAGSIPDFWRRWHITLMSWFKDYVYIPLGGSRCSSIKHWRNILTVFMLSGLWHGANWTFVCWGLYHAVWFRLPHRYLTFPIVVVGWVIFRSPDLATAVQYIGGMFDPSRFGSTSYSRMCLIYIAAFVVCEYTLVRQSPFAFGDRGWGGSQIVRMTIYVLCFLLTLYLGGAKVNFIYFQF